MDVDVNKLMATAEDEMNYGQYSDANRHFDYVAMNDPTNLEAPFYRTFCESMDLCGRTVVAAEVGNYSGKFTSSFSRYVDSVKRLNDPATERQKLDHAVDLLTQLYSAMRRQSSALDNPFSPGNSLVISTAAENMNKACLDKLKSVNANVSTAKLEEHRQTGTRVRKEGDKSNRGIAVLFIIFMVLVFLGAIGFFISMVLS